MHGYAGAELLFWQLSVGVDSTGDLVVRREACSHTFGILDPALRLPLIHLLEVVEVIYVVVSSVGR